MEPISYEEFVEILMKRAKENEMKNKMLVFSKSGYGGSTSVDVYKEMKSRKEIPYEEGKHAYKKEVE